MSIKQYLRGEMFLALARTFLARGIAALGTLLLGVVLGRLYGTDGVGVFALAQSVLLGAGILARYGLDNTLMRYVGRDQGSKHVGVYLKWACCKAGVLSFVAALFILVLRGFISQFFSSPELSDVLLGVGVAVPAFTLSFVLSGFMKGVRKPATANFLENGTVSLITALIIIWLHWLSSDLQLEASGWALAIAAWLVLAQGTWQAWRWFKNYDHVNVNGPECVDEIVHKEAFSKTSNAFLVMSIAQFVQQVVSVIIAGFVLSNGELGLFKTAERVALLISFVLLVVNAVFPPRFARLYYLRDFEGLSELVKKGACVGALMAAPLLILCLAAPSFILSWFGPDFKEAAALLRVMAVAQFFNVAVGSVGLILNMTGHEELVRNISIFCNVVGIFIFWVLLLLLDALGAAIGVSIVIFLQNIVALFFVWRRLGIWTLPGPNLFKKIPVQNK